MKMKGRWFIGICVCLILTGCSKSAEQITKSLQKDGFGITYHDGGFTGVNIRRYKEEIDETKNIVAYIVDDKVESISYRRDKGADHEELILGYFYITKKDVDKFIDKEAKKAAEGLLDELDLNTEELIAYVLAIHEDNGALLEEQ